MAYANSTAAHFAGFGLRDRIAAMARNYNQGAARRRVYRQTLAELSALTNRDLADLGLHRTMIKRVALDAANGK